MLNANRRRVTSRGTTGKTCRMISCMAALPEPSLLLSFEEARHLVDEHATRLQPRGKELLELLKVRDEFWQSLYPRTVIFRPFTEPCAIGLLSGRPIFRHFPPRSM